MSSGGPHFPQLSLQHAMMFGYLPSLRLHKCGYSAQVESSQPLPPSSCMHASLSAQVPEGGHAIGDATWPGVELPHTGDRVLEATCQNQE